MGSTTSRLALPYPVPGDSVDVPRDVQALADKLDPNTVIFTQGTAGARPAAGTAGRYYYATDTGIVSYDTGSVWVTVGPSVPDITRIADSKLVADAAQIRFASIPATYSHLVLVASARSTIAGTSDRISVRCNDDTTTTYFWQSLRANGTTPTASETRNATSAGTILLPAASSPGSMFGSGMIVISDYAGGVSKGITSFGGAVSSNAVGGLFAETVSGMWYAVATVTTVTLFCGANLLAGTHVTLYGLR